MRVSISGSYRKFPEQLRQDLEQFRSLGVIVLSPPSAELTRVFEEFAMLRGDIIHDIQALPSNAVPHAFRIIENSHLEAIVASDLLWITSVDGYCGNSTAFEVGWALAHKVPVYSLEKTVANSHEPIMRAYVNSVKSIMQTVALPLKQVPAAVASYWSAKVLESANPSLAVGAVIVDVSREKDVLERPVLVVNDGDWNGRSTIVGGRIFEGQDVREQVRAKVLEKTALSGELAGVVYSANMIPRSGYRDPLASRVYVDFEMRVRGKPMVPANCEWIRLSDALTSDDIEPNARASLESYALRPA